MPPTRRTTRKRADADGNVTLKLAHPLTAEQAQRIGAGDEDLNVGDEIKIHHDMARSVINSGYAQVDPEDNEAVADALGGTPPPAPPE
jgi:hypothetical protein